MKKVLLFLALSVGYSTYSFSQRTCAAMENLDRLTKEDPRLVQKMDNIEKQVQQIIRLQKNAGVLRNDITIPVVFHVIYNNEAENLSDSRIMSQLTVLQEDFNKQNTDHTNTPSEFASLVADLGINFVIADTDPNGNPHTGITRTQTSKSSFGTNDDMKYTSRGGHDAWPTGQYLNFWVCDLGSTLLGYAQFPGGPAETDGVVCHYKYTGTGVEGAVAPYDKGRTATHEVGHWLNLRHIWGDATCGDDLVSDTPTQLTSNSGCPSHPKNSCTSNDMFMNYMDYVNDACMYMFSEGQKERVLALFGSGGFRESFVNGGVTPSSYCASKGNSVNDEWIANVTIGEFNNATGANGGYADFTAQEINLSADEQVSLSLSPGFSGSTYAEYWKIWIDYNADMDFDDAGELVFDAGSTSSSTVNGSFTVPSNVSGSTRMRVSMKYNGAQTACEAFSYGEVEDYTVTFGEPEPEVCDTPTSVNSSNLSDTGFDLSWTAVGNANTYDVEIKLSSGASWTAYSSSNTNHSFTGLIAETSYDYRVKTQCSTTTSEYSTIGSVTTTAPAPEVCEAPNNISTSNITETSFTLSWSAMQNAQSYDVDYRATGTSTWTSSNETGTSKTFSSLDAETTYEYRLQTNCTEGSSGYSTIGSVTTEAPAPAVYCSANGTASSEWIEQVIVGSINNTSDNDNGYGNYTGQTVSVTQGENVSFTLNPGFTSSLFFGENTQPEYWRIYIDYNQDKDFDDAGELAYDANGTSTGNVSGSISIPTNVTTGVTRMRVVMKRSSGASPCGSIGNGEVEDYSININQAASLTCDTPNNVSANAISTTEFTANWSSSANAQSYIVDMRPENGSWTSFTTTNTSYIFSGLNTESDYEFKVAAICSFGTSDYSSVVSVTTLADNPEPVTYCTSNGGNSSDEWIANVAIGNLNNNSGNNNGYANFTNQSIQANQGGSVSFTLTPGFTSGGLFGSSSYPEYWKIWIDYNQDGDFDDAGELAFDAGSTSESAVSGNITIPNGALTGTTRVRVSMKYNGAPTACESFGYGEVEDYSMVIGSAARLTTAATTTPTANITLFPNPSKGFVTLTGLNLAQIAVYDLTGRLLLNMQSQETQEKFDVSDWNAGVYVLMITQDNQVFQQQLVVE